MDRQGMTLEMGITMFPRVFAWDAGGAEDIPADVIVERFFVPPFKDSDSLLDTCHFALIVVRKGKVEMSLVCRSHSELEHDLIANVHGGRELAYGEHWSSSLEEHAMRKTKCPSPSNTVEEIPEHWRGFLPETQRALLAARKKGGQALAQQITEAIAAEINRSQQLQAAERTALLVEVMESGEELVHPQLSTELFEVARGLEAWVAFTTEASVEELYMLHEAIRLRKQALGGRKQLASL